MIDELAFSEKMLEKEQERCPMCGKLKGVGWLCTKCFQEARDKRKEGFHDDATMFGREFFMNILSWFSIYMEPQDIFTAEDLEAWAVDNGWVPEEVQDETE